MHLLSKLKNNLASFLSFNLTSKKKRAIRAIKNLQKQKKKKTRKSKASRITKKRNAKGYILISPKYSIIASIAFIIIALFSYNLPQKYQLANLINSNNIDNNVETPQRGVSTGNQSQSQSQTQSQNTTNQGLINQTPTTMTNNGQSMVLAETIVNDQVAFAKATANQGKKTLQMAGSLTNKDGKPVEGTLSIRFAIYTKDRNTLDPAPSNTDQNQRIWEETRDITFKKGIFQVELGEKTDLPTITENSNQLFIGMRISTDSEMVPRKRISTPLFSFNAGNSITLNGKKIGTNSGDIPTLNENGQININNIPIGTNNDQLVLGNDKRLKYTITGSSFISLSGQAFKINKINLTNDIQNTLAISNGGTGLTSYTAGDLFYYTSGDSLTKLPIGTTGKILTVENGLPLWKALSAGSIDINSSLIPSTSGLDLGSSTNHWSNLYVDNMTVGLTNVNGTSSEFFAINTDATTDENMGIRFYRASLNGYAGLFWNATNQNFNLYKKENTQILADLNVQNFYAGGNVGIGTTNPGEKLVVNGNIIPSVDNTYNLGIAGTKRWNAVYANNFSVGNFNLSSGTLAGGSRGGAVSLIGPTSGGGYALGISAGMATSYTGGYITFTTDGTEKVRIANNGNVGIGTTNPLASLHTTGAIRADATTGVIAKGITSSNFNTNLTLVTATGKSIIFQQSNTEIARFSDSGLLGIGSTAPGARLQVVGADDISTNFATKIGGATTTGLVVTNSGNIGIGTNTPEFLVDIAGGLSTGGDGKTTNIDSYFSSPFLSLGETQNFLAYSEAFDQSIWVKTNIGTVTSNTAMSPAGATYAELIPAGSDSSANLKQTITNATTGDWTFSVWLRAQSGTATVALRIDSSGETGTSKDITLTTSWKRVTVMQNLSVAHTTKTAYIVSGTNAIAAWGAQLEPVSSARPYGGIRTGASTGLRNDIIFLAGNSVQLSQYGTLHGLNGVSAQTLTATALVAGATSVDGINLTKSGATAGVPVQISPRVRFTGAAWDTGTTASKTMDWIIENLPISGNPATSRLQISNQNGGGGYVNYFNILDNGNVGIGTTNPGYKLQVFTGTANGYVNTDGTWGSSSDINLKKNIFPIPSILNNILALNPVSYDFKTEKDGTISHIGFIAQEVEKLFPELVSTGPDGIKGISYAMFTPLLTKAIQQQQTQITGITENQNKIVNQLTGQLADQSLSVDSKLQLIGQNLDNIQTQLIASLQEQITTQTSDITELKDQIKTLQDQTKSVIDFQLAFNLDKVIIKDALGNISLLDGKITAKDIEVLGVMKAKDIEATNSLKGKNIELSSDVSGTSLIKAGELESVKILTTEAKAGVKIYITPLDKLSGRSLYIDREKIEEGVGFSVELDGEVLSKDVNFNWLIVK
jgi:hypothetical protein